MKQNVLSDESRYQSRYHNCLSTYREKVPAQLC